MPDKILNTRDQKIALEKTCWNLKRALDKRERQAKRLEKLSAEAERTDKLIAELHGYRDAAIARLRLAGWTDENQQVFEKRIGLVLPKEEGGKDELAPTSSSPEKTRLRALPPPAQEKLTGE